jgi:hypothetical protein
MPRAAARAKPGEMVATGLRLELEDYLKAHRAAEAAGLSLNGYIAALVSRDTVDENGCPTWAETPPEQLTTEATEPAA